MTVRTNWRTWLRRGVVTAGAVALGAGLLTTGAQAARSPVPVPKVALPATVDWQAEYQGQKICSNWEKPGAVKLSALLRRTYGDYITYISRSCETAGISEHEEGRAIDWMVNSEVGGQRAKAEAFLDWVTAPGPKGEPGAMARRLGIMYLIWDDKMWRVYRPEDGWTEYNGCSNYQDDGYDTSCHRDHIHMSLTWDGAYARTSFWTGRAEIRPPCESSSAQRRNGSATNPATLINSDRGTGLAARRCRLGASDDYRSRSYQVTVPVPDHPDGTRVFQRIKLTRFSLNSPTALVIRSARTIRVPQTAQPGAVIDVPLADDGSITFTVDAGYSQVWARGLGTYAMSDKPSRVKISEFDAPSRVNTPLQVRGYFRNAPPSSAIVVQRRTPGGDWASVAFGKAQGRRYLATVAGATAPGTYEFRSILLMGGVVLAESPYVRELTVKPAKVQLAQPTVAGRTVTLAGSVAGAPAGAVLQVVHQAPGGDWVPAKQVRATNGDYSVPVTLKARGEHRFRVKVVDTERTWDRSARRSVQIG